jgi:tetratricopeptide (TPR) repeat protein
METSDRNQKIEQAFAALNSGDPNACLELCHSVLETNMNDAEAWSIYGLAGLGMDPENAIQALQRAVQLERMEPRWRIHLGYGFSVVGKMHESEQVLKGAVELSKGADDAVIPWAEALYKMGKSDQAKAVLKEQASKTNSPNAWVHLANILAAENDLIASVSARENAYLDREMPREEQLNIANMHITLGQFENSQAYVDDLMKQDPLAPDTARLAANLMRWRGELDSAHEVLINAYDKHKSDPSLLLSLLDLNRDEDAHLIADAKAQIENDSLQPSDRRGLAFVVARRADRSGNYDEAWDYAKEANSLYTDGARSEVDQYKTHLDRAVALYHAVPSQDVAKDAEHIYVIGPPRSGGSLLQTILAADPGLVSVGERGALMTWILPLLDGLADTGAAAVEWEKVAAQLPLADTAGMVKAHPSSEGKTLVDKMPHHAHVAGMLARVHARSRFIDVRRDPFDIAMSILLHDFTDKFGYSRAMKDIADYLVFQREAVTTWQKAGLDILLHNHDEFLDAPKEQGKGLFKNLGLKWKDDYLKPENRKSTVRTFSALQVRSKVTKAYSGRGQNYKQFMGDAANILETLK